MTVCVSTYTVYNKEVERFIHLCNYLMGKLEKDLLRYEAKFKELYSPDTAIGNTELISLQATIERIKKTLDENYECDDCEGWGVTECECCSQDRTCECCKGEGLIKKPK